jgi:hypothetical protein
MEDGGVSRSSANTLVSGSVALIEKKRIAGGHPGRMTNQTLWEQNCCGAAGVSQETTCGRGEQEER